MLRGNMLLLIDARSMMSRTLKKPLFYISFAGKPRQRPPKNGRILASDAGWSSLAARRAHNPKVVGSNPAPATSNSVLSP